MPSSSSCRIALAVALCGALVGTSCGEGLLSGPGEHDQGGAGWDAGGLPALDAAPAPEQVLDAAEPEPEPDAAPPPPPPPPPPAGPPADCPRIIVRTPGSTLNVRPAPATTGTPLGVIPDGALVDVLARVQGQAIDGNSTWYEVKYGALQGFVSANWVECTTATKPPAGAGFYLPFPCGKQVSCTQGNNSGFSHTGDSAYAFDFGLGIGTPMVAMDAGTVSWVYNKTKPGDPCYDGGGPSCIAAANQVWVKHADGTQTVYAHLSSVAVGVGQAVARGQTVGLSGQTGYSTGPHAHVARMRACCASIPLKFADVPGSGVPTTGQKVTSGNCP